MPKQGDLFAMPEFPSPCGVMVIGNRRFKNASQRFNHKVSVPLRGNGYRKSSLGAKGWQNEQEFPSPCGVMVIGNSVLSKQKTGLKKRFRPLAG